MTMTATDRRRGERGQILTLVVLTMATMAVMAMTAITFGQALVRRQQAQLVVDTAALAGAAEQAKGLNTIARINKRQYDFLNALAYAQMKGVAFGYEDSYSTTGRRILRLPCLLCAGDDWALTNWKRYDNDVFGFLNIAADGVNVAYRPEGKPAAAAKKIVQENFEPTGTLFKSESLEEGVVIPLYERAFPERSLSLVRFEPRQQYRIGGARRYTPNPGHPSVWCPEMIGIVPNLPCIALKKARAAAYLKENTIFNARAIGGDIPRYRLGNFYDVPTSRDIRFTYYLQVPAARPIFGADYLKDIPKIVVVASAKPYAGHLGDRFRERALSSNLVSWGYDEVKGREISPTYRAKLVPVRLVDKVQLASMVGAGGKDAERFITAFH
jgi:hypothetical protein